MKIMNGHGFRRVMIGTGLDMYLEGGGIDGKWSNIGQVLSIKACIFFSLTKVPTHFNMAPLVCGCLRTIY